MKTNLLRGLAIIAMVWLLPFSAQAFEIQDIKSPKGVEAWFVQDQNVPIVSIQFDFKGGAAQDPSGKTGEANLMSGLLDEGAGQLKSQQYQQKLDALSADLGFGASQDYFSGHMKVLAENINPASDLLALALQKPRFDEEPVNRIREQIIVGINAAQRDPVTIAKKKFAKELYGQHPYSRQIAGTAKDLKTITREDLLAYHKKIFARDNVKIGIVGPLSKEEAQQLVAKIFDPLPAQANLKKIDKVKPHLGGLTTVSYDMPQTNISLVYPGVARDDKDYYAAYLVNRILGGSGLTSRLFSEVREKHGLAYSVGSVLGSRAYSDSIMIATGTRAQSAQQSLELIRSEVKKIATKGITAEELKNAKSYAIGAYAVQNMGSSDAIASILVGLQDKNLPINYLQERVKLINAVTLEEANAIAKKLFSVEPAIMMVGPMKN